MIGEIWSLEDLLHLFKALTFYSFLDFQIPGIGTIALLLFLFLFFNYFFERNSEEQGKIKLRRVAQYWKCIKKFTEISPKAAKKV